MDDTRTHIDVGAFEAHVKLAGEVDELEAVLKERKKELAASAELLIDELAHSGLRNLPLASGTVYVRTDKYPRPKEGDIGRLAGTLRDLGYGDLAKTAVNMQSLRALMREMEESDGIPAALADVVEVNEVVRLGVRKS